MAYSGALTNTLCEPYGLVHPRGHDMLIENKYFDQFVIGGLHSPVGENGAKELSHQPLASLLLLHGTMLRMLASTYPPWFPS